MGEAIGQPLVLAVGVALSQCCLLLAGPVDPGDDRQAATWVDWSGWGLAVSPSCSR